MSDMRKLLESMNKFAGQAVGQKPGDQVRGREPMPKKGGHKKHPFAGRLVGGGAAESVDPDLKDSLKEEFEQYVSEYGAPGSAIGNDTATNPAEQAALRQQQNAQKAEVRNQVKELQAQVQAARAQIAQLNRGFPQGANPVEKAMSLRDIQAQKVALNGQIEDLMKQIVALRSQTI